MSSRPATPLPDYPDNLAVARAEGRTGGWDHRPPVNEKSVRDVAAALIDDPDYLEQLQKRLKEGTAGAIEIWLWRWRWGDPKRAGEANADEADRKFKAMRADVLMLIKERPEQAADLEDRLLDGMRPKPLPLPRPERGGDALLERLEAQNAEEDE